jgi:hypothetical protein
MKFFTLAALYISLMGLLTACQPNLLNAMQDEIQSLKKQLTLATDRQEIENLMARRAMFHSIGRNEQELALWSTDSEIRWAQNQGCWIGREAIENYYVTVNYAMQKAQLAAMSAANPAIKNDFNKNRYIGNNVYHLLTTPLIEVAGDGQTAKAFWYTPGVILSSVDGLTSQGINMWEKYHVDLVKEQGQWRFLHIQVSTDWAAPFGEALPVQYSAVAAMGTEGAEKQSPGPGAEGIEVPGPTIAKRLYQEYSPTRQARLSPKLPEPYDTLSHTFEYADCISDSATQ